MEDEKNIVYKTPEQAIKGLKDYCELDKRIRNFSEKTDFDVFCDDHILDIESLIYAYEELTERK